MNKIILIAGGKGQGKDTFAGILKELKPELALKAFADPLKDIICKSLNITRDKLDFFKNDESYRIGFGSPKGKLCTGTTVRQLLQNFGTEGMKPIFGNTVWAEVFATSLEPNTDYVVTDFRVLEEIQYLNENLGDIYQIITVQVQRDLGDTTDGHITENGLVDFEFDYVIDNNGTLDDLRVEAVNFLDSI